VVGYRFQGKVGGILWYSVPSPVPCHQDTFFEKPNPLAAHLAAAVVSHCANDRRPVVCASVARQALGKRAVESDPRMLGNWRSRKSVDQKQNAEVRHGSRSKPLRLSPPPPESDPPPAATSADEHRGSPMITGQGAILSKSDPRLVPKARDAPHASSVLFTAIDAHINRVQHATCIDVRERNLACNTGERRRAHPSNE
jgi:hypothetical protein